MSDDRGMERRRSQDLSPLRMQQGLSCLWHPAHPQDRQEGNLPELRTSSPKDPRARAGEPGEALCMGTASPHLCWADGYAHHLHTCLAPGTKTLHLLRDHHPCWWQPLSPQPPHRMQRWDHVSGTTSSPTWEAQGGPSQAVALLCFFKSPLP